MSQEPLEVAIQTDFESLKKMQNPKRALPSDVYDRLKKLQRSRVEEILAHKKSNTTPTWSTSADALALEKLAHGQSIDDLEAFIGKEGTFTYVKDDLTTNVPIHLIPRASSRSAQNGWGVCPLGQYKVNFEETKLLKHSRNTLKMVDQCKEESGLNSDPAQKVLAEHALYQILKASGVPGFDTRLMKVTYKNQDGKQLSSSYAFMIEDAKDTAQRYGSTAVPIGTDPGSKLQSKVASDMGMLLINSTADHSHRADHNHEFIQRGGKVYDIPYDFDFNPLVEGYVGQYGESGVSSSSFENLPGDKEEKLNTAALILSNKEKVYTALNKVPFEENSKYKKNIIAWLDKYFIAAQTYLKANDALNRNSSVQMDQAPKLWFQMDCQEQQMFLSGVGEKVLSESKINQDEIKGVSKPAGKLEKKSVKKEKPLR